MSHNYLSKPMREVLEDVCTRPPQQWPWQRGRTLKALEDRGLISTTADEHGGTHWAAHIILHYVDEVDRLREKLSKVSE